MTLTPHVADCLNVAGGLLAMLGSMYWGYELLGGAHGPMNLITRTVSYSLMFGIGYGFTLGPAFGAIAGLGMGTILMVEHQRVIYHQREYGSTPLNNTPLFGVARGVVVGIAAIPRYGGNFGILFGLLCSLFLYVVYRLRYAPTFDYRTHTRPVVTRHRLTSSLFRGLAVGMAGLLAALATVDQYSSVRFGVFVGVVAFVMSFLVGTFSPIIEYWADNMPDRQLAAVGIVIMLIGMAMQLLPSLVDLLGDSF